MTPRAFKSLKAVTIVILVLLAVQYELGMEVNFADPSPITPFAFSLPGVSEALRGAGLAALLHAGLGGFLSLLSLVSLVLSLKSRLRSLQVFGVLGSLGILLAAAGGLLFVLSGFQDNRLSHAMADDFILAFVFYFLELYFLKPPQPAGRG